ncbi:MAG: hypothetical protein JXB39_13310 [Deltaproteobacteria bacterium]|nr:hypothetical protein [Deltaproteobacteria bacterium]
MEASPTPPEPSPPPRRRSGILVLVELVGAIALALTAWAGSSSGLIDRQTASILGLGSVLLFGSLLLSFRSRPRQTGEPGLEDARRPSRPVPMPHWSPAPGVVPDVVLRPGDPDPTLEPEALRAPVETPPPEPDDPTVDVFPAPPQGPNEQD